MRKPRLEKIEWRKDTIERIKTSPLVITPENILQTLNAFRRVFEKTNGPDAWPPKENKLLSDYDA